MRSWGFEGKGSPRVASGTMWQRGRILARETERRHRASFFAPGWFALFKTLDAPSGPAGVTCRASQTGGWKMKHVWNALRTILVCVVFLGVVAMTSKAMPADQPSLTDKFKNL